MDNDNYPSDVDIISEPLGYFSDYAFKQLDKAFKDKEIDEVPYYTSYLNRILKFQGKLIYKLSKGERGRKEVRERIEELKGV